MATRREREPKRRRAHANQSKRCHFFSHRALCEGIWINIQACRASRRDEKRESREYTVSVKEEEEEEGESKVVIFGVK